MKIRRDALAISSILFTLALLVLTPIMMNVASVTHQSRFRDIAYYPDPAIPGDQVVIPNFFAPIGITSLAIIVIGLIVTWAGYFKAVRWTWFVMFVIVWLWAFPVLVLPLFHPWPGMDWIVQTLAPTLESAIRESGIAREGVKILLIFLLMVVALFLPVKTFILGRGIGPGGSGHANLAGPDKHAWPEI